MDDMKLCPKCQLTRSRSDFYTDKKSADGMFSYCKKCDNARRGELFKANRKPRVLKTAAEKLASQQASAKLRRSRNKETIQSQRKLYAATNRDKEHARQRAWRLENAARVKEQAATYAKTNASKYAERAMRRHAAKLQATPAWSDTTKIAEFYELAALLTRESGFAYEVDHIVPLQSSIVCGLHWEGNLQVLPLEKNRAKSNRHWPDMP